MIAPTCHPNRRHGGHGLCRPCYQREWRKTYSRERKRELDAINARRYRLKAHGLADRPEGTCPICGTTGALVVDHDHRCCPPNRSCDRCRRGFICSNCNRGLGYLGDSLESLENAVRYLRAHLEGER